MVQQPLRILAIVPSGFCFGLQHLTLALFSRLPREVAAHFLLTHWTDGEFARRLDTLKIPHSSTWLGMFSRRMDWQNLTMTFNCLLRLPLAWRDLVSLYRSFRPDVVYLANHHEAILLWPLLLLWRRKVVCHVHDPPPASNFHRCSFRVWRKAVGRFLFISESARSRLRQLGRLTMRDAVVYNGVPIEPLELPRSRSTSLSEMFGWPASSVIVGITGQISSVKGHEDFIEAASLAAAANERLRFVIGGRGPEAFVASLRQRITERGLDSRLGFCGWLPTSRQFYEAIDILVLASRHEEGFGLVVAEAGERAVPVIATRSGGAVEIILDSQTGLLVDRESPRELARAMLTLSADEPLRTRLGLAARERISSQFNLEKQVTQFVNFLRPTSGQPNR